MGRDSRDAKLVTDRFLEAGDDSGFTMDQHDSLGFLLHGGDPFEQTIPVSMAGEALDHFDPGFDGDLLTKNPDRLCAINQRAAEGTPGLVPDKNDRGILAPEIMLEMMADPAGFAHPAGGDDDLAVRVFVELAGFVGGLREMQIVEIQRMIAAFEVGTGFVIKAVGVFLEHLGRGDRQRAIDIDRGVMQQPALAFEFFIFLVQGIDQFLGPADGKGRDDHIATPLQRFFNRMDKAVDFVIGPVVQTITIGRFEDEVIGTIDNGRISEDRDVLIAQVTGKNEFGFAAVFLDPDLQDR